MTTPVKRWNTGQRMQVYRRGRWISAVYLEPGERTHMHWVLMERSQRYARVLDNEIKEGTP